MKRFDYKLLTLNAVRLRNGKIQAEIDSKFRKLGNEGWELVKLEPILTGGMFRMGSYTSEFLVVFKREKLEE